MGSIALLTGCGNKLHHYQYHAQPQSAVEKTDVSEELPNSIVKGGYNLINTHGFDLLAFSGDRHYSENLEAFHDGGFKIQRNTSKQRGKYKHPVNYVNNVFMGDGSKVRTTFHKHSFTLKRNSEADESSNTLKLVKYRLHGVADVSATHSNRTRKIQKRFVFYPYEIKRKGTSAHHLSEQEAKRYPLTLTRVSSFSQKITNGSLPYD